MEPLNKTDRKKAFTNFFLLFLLCIAIIATTIFFSIQVPFKQNERLLMEMRTHVKEREFSTDFMTQMSGIAGMLDTINTKALKPDLLDGRITEGIKKLNLKIDADSTNNKPLFRSVVFVLSDIQTAKKQLREITGKDINADDLRKQIEGLNTTLEASKFENLNLKQQIFILQQTKN
jgi:Type VI secretion system, TssO